MRTSYLAASIALLTTLSACGGAEPSADDMINDATDMAADITAASSRLPQELRLAAGASGDMPCGLPKLPGARVARSINPASSTYNTDSEPAEVAAFYSAAAEARGATATTGGPHGMTVIKLALGEEGDCEVVAQAQMPGDTNVLVSTQP
ncbi:MAG: hypothetical protein WBA51_13650 [Erythrobacter sp.]